MNVLNCFIFITTNLFIKNIVCQQTLPAKFDVKSSSSSLFNNLNNQINDINDDNNIKKPNLRDKCRIEIETRGSCMVNNNPVKPKIIIHLKPSSKSPHHYQSPMEKHRNKLEEDKIGDNIISIDSDEYKQKVIFEFTNQLIKHMISDYGDQLKPLMIDIVQSIRLRNYGMADVYELKIYGLDQIEPIAGSVEMNDSLESSIWSFNISFFAANITADFYADINMDEKIFVKKWNLGLRIDRCKIHSSFTLDFNQQSLFVNSFHLKTFENFRLISEPLTWPFSDIVTNIVQQEKHFIRHIIELYSSKYLNMTLSNNYDMNSILQKIFNDQSKR